MAAVGYLPNIRPHTSGVQLGRQTALFMQGTTIRQAKVLPGGNEFELTRFQQSLVFERGISNRSLEQVRAIRESCRGLAGVVNAAGNPANPAGVDDPRCQVRR